VGVIRTIGNYELLVEPGEPCGISLEESLAARVGSERGLSKAALMRLLASGDDYYPISLFWEMLDSCNLSCPFCYIVGHSFNKVVRFPDVHQHLAKLVEAGVLFCTLTGGEATIHPDFAEIYEFLKERGVVVEVYTNGAAITDDIITLFQRLPPVAVEVSIYTLQNRRFREIYGFRGDFGATRVLENVIRLRDAGVNVVCKTFLTTVTSADIDEVRAWCAEQGVEHYSSSEITMAYDGTALNEYAVPANPSNARSATGASAVCLPCGTKNYGSAINPAFEIYPCQSIRLPDCRYDLRTMGVTSALAEMKAFMRKYQSQKIRSIGGSGCATCIAGAAPVRDKNGSILYFADPSLVDALGN